MPDAPSSSSAHSVLNLGSGLKRRDNSVNVDLTPDTHPDVVHDLDQVPWPFETDRFVEVHAYDVLEHLDDLVATFEEIHRISKPGAVVRLTVPHFSCVNAFADPTHRHFFSLSSFKYFTGEHEHSFYTRTRFRTRACSLVFSASWSNKVVRRLALRYPDQYEARWA